MPIITFDGGKLSKEQKCQLAKELTDAGENATGIRREAFVVILRENDSENIGVGGCLLADKKK